MSARPLPDSRDRSRRAAEHDTYAPYVVRSAHRPDRNAQPEYGFGRVAERVIGVVLALVLAFCFSSILWHEIVLQIVRPTVAP